MSDDRTPETETTKSLSTAFAEVVDALDRLNASLRRMSNDSRKLQRRGLDGYETKGGDQ